MMGVDIGTLVVKKEIELDALRGRRLGVDAYNVLYQFLTTIRGQDGQPLMDAKGRVTSHLTGLLYRSLNLIERDIQLVYVFDGEPHPLKTQTLEKRTAIRTDAKEKMEKAEKEGDVEAYKKFASRAAKLTPEMAKEAKQLLSHMGVPCVEAVRDGEAQIAAMTAKGDLFACMSQDYDALLYGSPRLLRNIAVTGRRKLPGQNVYADVAPTEILLEETLSQLGLNRKKLVWLAILIGTDFNEKVPGVGPKTALKLVKEHDTFEEILATCKKPPKFEVEALENLFLNPEVQEEYSLSTIRPDTEGLKKFLCDEHDFSPERVENAGKKLLQHFEEKGTQARLDAWN